MKKYLIVSYVVLLSVSAIADIKYNPYSNDWERSPSDGILKYNPYDNDWSYERPNSTLEYNPYNNTWGYSRQLYIWADICPDIFLNKISSQTLISMNKGENMKKMLKIVALLSVMIGNFAIFQSNANALVSVDGYFRSNGTYVAPHFRTSPDGLCFNNFNGC